MRLTARLLQQQQKCRITLFTRPNCGLCTRAKSALAHVWDARPFDYREVDVIDPVHKGWRDLYDLDVPVIHVSKITAAEEDPKLASRAVKLMHRFDPDDVKAKMDLVEKNDA
ncbi:glutaredoxin domain protein [Sporothrix schenckii 1099-18]|uniref:Glutaredoxin-like protein n=2 Tax=Sporothrix schenckii TaxID=29908 RepID=U7PJ75_SPOS1|nr:glutaredoxin domain protein [Sporothrix schenckii 1099-18]ERS95587.1 hypothetical protein HMPREF1624_08103 [Sporothrix schenckii ATCC 58251]KJR86602.1 glutaredoxin domain protein [Sporothrix schenckii 1099-18]